MTKHDEICKLLTDEVIYRILEERFSIPKDVEIDIGVEAPVKNKDFIVGYVDFLVSYQVSRHKLFYFVFDVKTEKSLKDLGQIVRDMNKYSHYLSLKQTDDHRWVVDSTVQDRCRKVIVVESISDSDKQFLERAGLFVVKIGDYVDDEKEIVVGNTSESLYE